MEVLLQLSFFVLLRAARSPNTAFSTVKRAHSPYRLKTLNNECRLRSNLANQVAANQFRTLSKI